MEFTEKKLVDLLKISQPALFKALKKVDYELKEVEGSAKKVKHYKYDDLPQRYKDKLEVKGIKPEEKMEENKLAFTSVYLLAGPEKQKKALLKCKLIEFYLKRDGSLNQSKWLENTLKNDLSFEELGGVSTKQLNDWVKKYNDTKAKGTNVVEAFIDSRGRAKGVIALTQDMQETAIRYFLKRSRPMMSEVYRNMCHTFGNSMPSSDVLYKFYKDWKIKNPVLYEFSKSPDSAKNKFLVAYGDMSAKAKYRNHYVELDSTPADVICEDGKRYAVLAAIDVHTRRGVFHVSETSSSYSISQLLRKYILKFGIPENVVVDNGKDYTSNHFQSICSSLQVNMVIVPPFSGECKPHVERWFGTLSSELFEQIEGYVGHNVAQRAELQARKSFADKIHSQEKWREEQAAKTDEEKKAFRDAWKIKKENRGLELAVLTTADELQLWCDNWNTKIYEQRVHKGIKTSPLKKWQKEIGPVQGIPDERMLDLLLGESFIRKVGKKGISYDGCQYAHLDLIEYTGKSVFVMTPADMGYILVYDENMKFICIAEDLEHMGQDRYKVRAGRKKSLALMKQLNKIVEAASKIEDTSIKERIEAVQDVVENPTIAVTKHTVMVDALLESSPVIEAKDKEQLEQSKTYDFKKKDENNQPTKILPGGRPTFDSMYDRFMWALKNDDWNEKDEKLSIKHNKVFELVKEELKVS